MNSGATLRMKRNRTTRLTINVTEGWKQPELSQNYINSALWMSSEVLSPKSVNSFTPDTGCTFGRRNPTYDFSPTLSPTPSECLEQLEECRQRRYLAAEVALADTALRCSSEPSERELQIRMLKQAAAVLSDKAEEARERCERIRDILSTRDVQPEVARMAKVGRWMEEKQFQVLDDGLKNIEQNLDLLDSSSRRLSIPKPRAPDLSQCRRQENLDRFFSHSHTFIPLRKSHQHVPTTPSEAVILRNVSKMYLRRSIVPKPRMDTLQVPPLSRPVPPTKILDVNTERLCEIKETAEPDDGSTTARSSPLSSLFPSPSTISPSPNTPEDDDAADYVYSRNLRHPSGDAGDSWRCEDQSFDGSRYQHPHIVPSIGLPEYAVDLLNDLGEVNDIGNMLSLSLNTRRLSIPAPAIKHPVQARDPAIKDPLNSLPSTYEESVYDSDMVEDAPQTLPQTYGHRTLLSFDRSFTMPRAEHLHPPSTLFDRSNHRPHLSLFTTNPQSTSFLHPSAADVEFTESPADLSASTPLHQQRRNFSLGFITKHLRLDSTASGGGGDRKSKTLPERNPRPHSRLSLFSTLTNNSGAASSAESLADQDSSEIATIRGDSPIPLRSDSRMGSGPNSSGKWKKLSLVSRFATSMKRPSRS